MDENKLNLRISQNGIVRYSNLYFSISTIQRGITVIKTTQEWQKEEAIISFFITSDGDVGNAMLATDVDGVGNDAVKGLGNHGEVG